MRQERGRGTRGFDAVLMDVEMPVMNGLEATAAIRALEVEGERLPIIALTGVIEEHEERQRCVRSGMDDFTTKPLSVSICRELMRVHTKRHAK